MDGRNLSGETKTERKKKALFLGILAYLLFLFTTVLIRSVISSIIYDEAYTYINYGLIDLFNLRTLYDLFSIRGCIANNHWLNSILINLLHQMIGADYNEFIIRLPAVCFFAMYLIGVVYGYKQKHYSLPALVFLVSNYYLLEYYGLARGYAMANTCVFFACLSFCKWKDSEYQEVKHLRWLMTYMSIAVFANTIVLLLYPAFGLICLYRILQQKQFKSIMKNSGIIVGLFVLFTLVMLKYHMNISTRGKPLYTGGEMGFFDSVIKGYAKMFVYQESTAAMAGIALAVSVGVCFAIEGKDLINMDFSAMLIIFVGTNIFMQFMLHRGYITARVLLPFYAFLVFCFDELYSNAWDKAQKSARARDAQTSCRFVSSLGKCRLIVSGFACVIIIFSCLLKTNLIMTNEWGGDHIYKFYVEGELLTGEAYPRGSYTNWSETFYQQKYEAIKDEYLMQINLMANDSVG